MMIAQLDAAGVHIPFAQDFPVSYETERTTHHVFVRIRTDDGRTGYGEGTALPWFTGDVADGLEEVVRDFLAPALEGTTLEEATSELRRYQDSFPGTYGALAAVETALLDLRAKRLNVPLFELLGTRVRDSVPVVAVIPALAPDLAAARARDHVEAGYERLKIKADGDVATDVERINAVIDELPPGGTVRVDANTSWKSYPTAARALEGIVDLDRLEYLEQPVGVDRVTHMERLWADYRVPVFADESVSDTGDVERHGSCGRIAGCHLKLAKSGSLLTLAEMAARARDHDMTVSVVSAFGTSLEATANLHLAAVVENTSAGVEICTDLLAEDYGTPLLKQAPELPIPTDPGVGVELDDAVF